MLEALFTARKMLGSGKKLANAIGVSNDMINSWITRGVCVPLEHAFNIERVTKGAVPWTAVSPHLAHNKKYWLDSGILQHNFCLESANISVSKLYSANVIAPLSDDIYTLTEAIKRHGLQRAIAIDTDNQVIFGIKRLQAYRYLGLRTILGWRLSLSDLLQTKYSQTIITKTFLISERVAIGIALEKYIGNRRSRISREKQVKENLFDREKRTNEIIAHRIGFGNRESYTQAKKVYLQGSAALIATIDNHYLPVSTAAVLATLPIDQQTHILTWPKKAITAFIHQRPRPTVLPIINPISETEDAA